MFLASVAVSPSQAGNQNREGGNQIRELEGIYLGHAEGGFSFSCQTAQGIEEIRIFDKVLSVVLEKYPLHLNKHIGERFTISFATSRVIRNTGTKEVSTILRLRKPLPGRSDN